MIWGYHHFRKHPLLVRCFGKSSKNHTRTAMNSWKRLVILDSVWRYILPPLIPSNSLNSWPSILPLPETRCFFFAALIFRDNFRWLKPKVPGGCTFHGGSWAGHDLWIGHEEEMSGLQRSHFPVLSLFVTVCPLDSLLHFWTTLVGGC